MGQRVERRAGWGSRRGDSLKWRVGFEAGRVLEVSGGVRTKDTSLQNENDRQVGMMTWSSRGSEIGD